MTQKSEKMKALIRDLKADLIASKEDHERMELTVMKLMERQKKTNERIDRKVEVLCDEMEKRCELKGNE